MFCSRTSGTDEESSSQLSASVEMPRNPPWILAAAVEERLREGEAIPSDFPDRMTAALDPGIYVEPHVRRRMEHIWGCSLEAARIHSGPITDQLCGCLGAPAFCAGQHIVVHSHVAASPVLSRMVLEHELTHLALNPSSPRVRFWGGDDHKKLTALFVAKYLGDHQIIVDVVEASLEMDVRSKRLMKEIVPYVVYMARLRSFPAEGPEHGEGGLYEIKDEEKARKINIDCARARLDKAIAFYREWRDLMDELTRARHNFLQKMGPVNDKRKGMIANLGDALHIAQDRGSHYEGLKGRGHDDQRAFAAAWDPDNPKDNPEGYEKAKTFTREVFEEFRRKVLACPKAGSSVRLLV